MRAWLVLTLFIAGCAADLVQQITPGMDPNEVSARAGKPVVQADGHWDYSRQPYGYYRVEFGPDKRVREVRNLHTEQNFRTLRAGMTQAEVAAAVGVTSWVEEYAFSTSWRYRYSDATVRKLYWVIFDAGKRVSWSYSEWDPDVYSKGGGKTNE